MHRIKGQAKVQKAKVQKQSLGTETKNWHKNKIKAQEQHYLKAQN